MNTEFVKEIQNKYSNSPRSLIILLPVDALTKDLLIFLNLIPFSFNPIHKLYSLLRKVQDILQHLI